MREGEDERMWEKVRIRGGEEVRMGEGEDGRR
jgi:hypothetical protein